jgi:glutamine amidotransferase-like uncharacterized protein
MRWLIGTVVLLGCGGGHEVERASTPAPAAVSSAPASASAATPAESSQATSSTPPVDAPLALVYRGGAGCDGCSESVAEMLQASKFHFRITYVGETEAQPISDDILAKATVYAQPGGDGSVEHGFAFLAPHADRIRTFVQNGGHYLGFCMGGYFAGKDPGFGLLPGDSDEYITSRQASVTTDKDTVIDVIWRGTKRTVYFQDGPLFIVNPGSTGTTTLASYDSNGAIAALVAPFGKGKVGVVGPHPEATDDWFTEAHVPLAPPGGHAPTRDLAFDLVETTMQ